MKRFEAFLKASCKAENVGHHKDGLQDGAESIAELVKKIAETGLAPGAFEAQVEGEQEWTSLRGETAEEAVLALLNEKLFFSQGADVFLVKKIKNKSNFDKLDLEGVPLANFKEVVRSACHNREISRSQLKGFAQEIWERALALKSLKLKPKQLRVAYEDYDNGIVLQDLERETIEEAVCDALDTWLRIDDLQTSFTFIKKRGAEEVCELSLHELEYLKEKPKRANAR